MLEVSCRLVVAEFGLKTLCLVAAFSFRICIAVKFRIVETNALVLLSGTALGKTQCGKMTEGNSKKQEYLHI